MFNRAAASARLRPCSLVSSACKTSACGSVCQSRCGVGVVMGSVLVDRLAEAQTDQAARAGQPVMSRLLEARRRYVCAVVCQLHREAVNQP
jgi:hypothetical protein